MENWRSWAELVFPTQKEIPTLGFLSASLTMDSVNVMARGLLVVSSIRTVRNALT